MKNLPKISEAEWQVMKVLWDQSPLTANQIVEQLANEIDWNPRTVKTFLNRLMNKNALGIQQERRVYYYYPLVSRDEYARYERENLLQRVYNGALQPLLAAFLQDQKLSKQEIDELKLILENKGK
ncbi:BlaI/MecI/CopY family transcriptional regulator [candidate division KSB1 bacterium]|nr:BlaI/MecI/CopY family transcriptional regulator [candidate division KSB1 bacterium]